MEKIHTRCKILAVKRVCEQFVQITLDAPMMAKAGRPGQVFSVRTAEGLDPFLRRPFGIYHRDNGMVEMLVEIRGRGTQLLAEKQPGETLDVLGPLGKGFSMPEQHIKHIVLIGGGIGVAPLLSLVEAVKGSGKEMILLYGARDRKCVFDLRYFEDAGCRIHIATDDGCAGIKGQVSSLFEYIPDASKTVQIYTCGPNPMMKCVQAFARERGIAGECTCEEIMACGVGACLGCVIQTTSGYKTACHDGPVFNLQDVVFDQGREHHG